MWNKEQKTLALAQLVDEAYELLCQFQALIHHSDGDHPAITRLELWLKQYERGIK